MKKKILLIAVLSIIFSNCSENNQSGNLTVEIENLRTENDSLKNILAEINNKYIFDSITIRDIASRENTNKLNSVYKAEIMFVGYNTNGKSTMVIGDSINYENGTEIVVNGDSLKRRKGSFFLEKKLTGEINKFWGILRTENKYGKTYEVNILTAVRAEKN